MSRMSEPLPELKVHGPDDDPYGDIEIWTTISVAGGRRVAKLWQDDAPCHDYNAEQRDFARQMVAAYNATRGLTPEQVEAIPRLVACFTRPDDLDLEQCEEHGREMDRLEAIFPRRRS